MIISHINPQTWECQSNEDHCLNVAKLSSLFADEFGFKEWGEVLGLLHDKGKEQQGFQRYIQKVTGYKPELNDAGGVPHANVGALIAKELYPIQSILLTNPIMGHHAGLYDYDELSKKLLENIPNDVSWHMLDVKLELPKDLHIESYEYNHLIRVLYSCLVDADYLDTEYFMDQASANERKYKSELIDLLPKLTNYLNELKFRSIDTPVNNIRNAVQEACSNAAEYSPGFYSLTVPTGGGKTISSLVWAMNHAIKYGKKRIVIAIPYTSIIVQTASVLRMIFGEENVLEHHSNSNPDNINDPVLREKMKLATENWDYPIVVTTNVQLFESMYSNKSSKSRKLHNLCNSVLILDEVQTLPIDYLQPIVDGLKAYQHLFKTSVLFTTASQPALEGKVTWKGSVNSSLDGIPCIREIIPDRMNLHEKLRRVNLHFDDAISSYDDIALRISIYEKVLCVVNSRKDAQEIYNRLPKEGLTIHLSRMMCASHIQEMIERISTALKDDNHPIIRVVSTQLIEAGVDIDFPVVFRQEAGLDSILQAAGRCNREGKMDKANAYVFRLDKKLPSGYISHARDALLNMKKNLDWFNPDTMIEYFIQLYSQSDTFDKAGIKTYLDKPFDFCFETAASKFHLIDDNGISIIVNYKDSASLVEELKKVGLKYSLKKRLSRYMVNVHERDFRRLLESNLVEEILEGVYFLPDREQYSDTLGLVIDSHWLEEILI